MFRLTIALMVSSIACGKSAAKQEHLQAGDLALVGATVVPMDRERTLTDHTVVEYAGKQAALDVAGTFSIDTDGAPHEVQVKVRWGTFVTKRVD